MSSRSSFFARGWPAYSAALLLACGATMAANAGEEWIRFRGPNGTGVNPGAAVPVTWTDQSYAWKATLPGAGSSSPIVSGGRVFVLAGDSTTARRFVVCLGAGDGSMLWTRAYDSNPFTKNRDNSYASSTPTADSDRVYAYWTTPGEITVLALDHAGKELWKRNLGPYKSQHGGGTSPILLGDVLVLNNDQDGASSLFALDKKSGKTCWQITRRPDRAAYATPCVREVIPGKSELVFASSSHGLTAVDPVKGCVNWEWTNAFPFRVVSSPIVAAGLVIGTCGEGGIGRRLVAVRPGTGSGAPDLVYEMKNNLPYVPTPLVVNDWLYLWCDNGLIVCHRAATGEKRWQIKISDSFYSSPVFANGHLYGVSKKGVVYVLAAGDQPELTATIPLGEGTFATPALGENALYLRTESHLFCVRATGAQPN